MTNLFETYEMSLRVLTPIHIGSGDEINPGDYFILPEDSAPPKLYAVDFSQVVARLKPESAQLVTKWIVEDPVKWVSKVLKQEVLVGLIKKKAFFSAEVSPNVVAKINQRWGTVGSRLGISMLQRCLSGPIIPGSSIKGALRTALLWSRVRKPLEKFPTKDREVASWERIILGSSTFRDAQKSDPKEDILRHLKVCDTVPSTLPTQILEAHHVGMKSGAGEEAELQDFRECFSALLRGSKESILTTRLTLETGHPHYAKCRAKLTKEVILKACREFYEEVLQADEEYFERQGTPYRDALNICREIRQCIVESPEAAPIRLGWGCGMDSVSLNLAKPEANYPTRRSDDRFRRHVTTRRLFDGKYPPGWALFTLEG